MNFHWLNFLVRTYVTYVRTDIIGTLRVPRGPKKTVIPKCKTGGYSTLSQMLSHVMVSLNICNCLCLFGGLVMSKTVLRNPSVCRLGPRGYESILGVQITHKQNIEIFSLFGRKRLKLLELGDGEFNQFHCQRICC